MDGGMNDGSRFAEESRDAWNADDRERLPAYPCVDVPVTGFPDA